jgi:DNA-binding CsgD family transcriptional regulator
VAEMSTLLREKGLRVADEPEVHLSEKQMQGLDLLAAGISVSETARQIGAARATVSRWLNRDVDFYTTLNLMRSEIHKSHGDRLRVLATRAYDVLEELMGQDAPPDVRLRAALAVTEKAKAIESEVGHKSRSAAETDAMIGSLPGLVHMHMIDEAWHEYLRLRRLKQERDAVTDERLRLPARRAD